MNTFRKNEEYIANKEPGVIYLSDFPDNKGKYVSMISQNQSVDVQISPKVQFRVSFIRDNNKLKGLEIIKLKKKGGWFGPSERVNLSTFEFSDLISFVELLRTVDPLSFSSRKLKLFDKDFSTLDEKSKEHLATILKTPDGTDLIKALVEANEVAAGDIVNISYRKEQLEVFRKMLNDPEYFKEYAVEEKITDTKEEKVWQHFFQKNDWIFGLGLDYQYLDIIENEAAVGQPNVSGKGAEQVDTLAKYNKFTVLIELKKPSSPLFDTDKNRSGSWKLSNTLQSAVSQILEYKASHQKEWGTKKEFDSEGNALNYYAYDPKSILLIGRNVQIDGEDEVQDIKRRTFELYRRDSRNIEIMTYDELYMRAVRIVNSKKHN